MGKDRGKMCEEKLRKEEEEEERERLIEREAGRRINEGAEAMERKTTKHQEGERRERERRGSILIS